MQVCSSSKGSAVSLSCTAASVSSLGTFGNRLTTSRLTVLLERMETLLILSTKWAKFLIYDKDLLGRGLMIFPRKWLNGWHAEPQLLTMGLNRIPSLCKKKKKTEYELRWKIMHNSGNHWDIRTLSLLVPPKFSLKLSCRTHSVTVLNFRAGSRVWQTSEEGRGTYRLKRCEYNNEDEDNSLKTPSDKKVKWFQVLQSISNSSIKHQLFIYIHSYAKTVLFQITQFSVSIQFSFIWPIDTTISGATTPGQGRPGNEGNEGGNSVFPKAPASLELHHHIV